MELPELRAEASLQISVEEDRRYLGALEQVVEIAVGPVELVDFRAELVIDGLQFLIDRLQFLLRSFELFIGRLQFLIDREQLFIGRAKLFVRRLELLDCRLQSLLGLLQLLLDQLNGRVLALWTLRASCFVLGRNRSAIGKYDPIGGLFAFDDRLDREADHLNTAVDLDMNTIALYALSGFLGAVERRAQIGAQARSSHSHDVAI